MDRETLIDDLEQVLDDSMDIDWNTRVGADRIADHVLKLFRFDDAEKRISSAKKWLALSQAHKKNYLRKMREERDILTDDQELDYHCRIEFINGRIEVIKAFFPELNKSSQGATNEQ